MKRRKSINFPAVVGLISVIPAFAQAHRERPLRMLMPYALVWGADAAARTVMKLLSFVNHLHGEVTKALKNLDVHATLAVGWFDSTVVTQAAYQRMLRADREKLAPVIRANNFQMD